MLLPSTVYFLSILPILTKGFCYAIILSHVSSFSSTHLKQGLHRPPNRRGCRRLHRHPTEETECNSLTRIRGKPGAPGLWTVQPQTEASRGAHHNQPTNEARDLRHRAEKNMILFKDQLFSIAKKCLDEEGAK